MAILIEALAPPSGKQYGHHAPIKTTDNIPIQARIAHTV